MQSFKEFLEEKFVNLIGNDPKKHDYKHEVHKLLNKAYEKIGGIHGSGFKDPDDMVQNVHMWKLAKHNGKIVAATMYKDKGGRKSVAVATDGTEHGKKKLGEIMKHDVQDKRAYSEKSGPALSFLKKQLPPGHITKHALNYDDARKNMDPEDAKSIRRPNENDPELIKHPELKDHMYQRKIGDEWHTKVMLGTPGKKIIKR